MMCKFLKENTGSKPKVPVDTKEYVILEEQCIKANN